MREKLISILITNYNKEKFLKKSITSCLRQDFNKKEILIFDDCSTDGSKRILKKFKKIKIIFNKNKRYSSGPLNQIYGIKKLFKKSKGDLIFLLDSDDYFKKSKIKTISKIFNKNNNLKFIQDKPFSTKEKKIIKLKHKTHLFSIWPSFYPTSCIAIKRDFFLKFLRYSESQKFPNLEIDARLCIFVFLIKSFFVLQKSLTFYNFDHSGITSNYKKYTFNWWKKRNEAYDYMKILMYKFKIKFKPGPDYYLTKVINFFI